VPKAGCGCREPRACALGYVISLLRGLPFVAADGRAVKELSRSVMQVPLRWVLSQREPALKLGWQVGCLASNNYKSYAAP
jgi:hypothetical protein